MFMFANYKAKKPKNSSGWYFYNLQKQVLTREIIILILIITLVILFILFFTPVVSKNVFFINFSSQYPNNNSNKSNIINNNINTSNTINDSNNLSDNNNYNYANIDKNNNYGLIKNIKINHTCSVGDFLKIKLIAKNIDGVDFTNGSINIKWKYENEGNEGKNNDTYNPLNQENIPIFVDGFSHTYYAAIGENKNWLIGKNISSILIELPDVKGININLNAVSLNKRIFTPLDSYINRFFKYKFYFIKTNKFLIPTYVASLFILIITYSLKLISKKVTTIKIIFSCMIIILFLFSIYFFKNEILTTKSYYDSYKNYIISGNFKDTYLGFYDFEKFLRWADEKIPKDENVIVLVRGNQTYIESEMAYNLYPRDLKFINISKNSNADILNQIQSLNFNSRSVSGVSTSTSSDDDSIKNCNEYIVSKNEPINNKNEPGGSSGDESKLQNSQVQAGGNNKNNNNNNYEKNNKNYKYLIALTYDDIQDANQLISNEKNNNVNNVNNNDNDGGSSSDYNLNPINQNIVKNDDLNLNNILCLKYNYKPDAGLIFLLK